MSSDPGPDCEEILAGRPFYLQAGMSVSTGMSTCTSTSVSEGARARVGREASVCVSDARCRAVARAAPPLASLRQAVACSSREERRATSMPAPQRPYLPPSELYPPERRPGNRYRYQLSMGL